MKKLILFFGILSFTPALLADDIHLVSDIWCPYACKPASPKPGFMVEIATEVFKMHGHKVHYKLVNWARAISETRSGKYTGLIGSSKMDAPDFIFPETPQGKNLNYFWTKKSSQWKYTGLDSLKGKKIGVINSYSYGDEVDQQIQNKNPSYVIVSGEDALTKMIRMTNAGRLDAFIENPSVLSYQLMSLPEYADKFESSSKNITNDSDLFVTFSPANKNSKNYAEMMTKGIDELRKSGKLKEILARYGLVDWK